MLVEQVLICEGNKPQIQSNHITVHWKNLLFLLKASPGLKCNTTGIGIDIGSLFFVRMKDNGQGCHFFSCNLRGD